MPSAAMSVDLKNEEQVAIAVVRRACTLTAEMFENLVQEDTVVKGDMSPVTVADFAVQATINTVLGCVFPDDAIVGEEDARMLRGPDDASLRARALCLARDALLADLSHAEKVEWGLGISHRWTDEDLLNAIDRGAACGGRIGRYWCLDPIDGTLGFLRGEQYAVCLALVVDAQVQLGIIGCPNLPLDANSPGKGCGVMFVAARGRGAWQIPLAGGHSSPIQIAPFLPERLNLVESVEASHSSHDLTTRITRSLDLKCPPLRLDSQAKYCVVARGDGGVYIRMRPPKSRDGGEYVWDHAPGTLLVEEAGGLVTDARGQPLDFGLGRTLGENFGVVAAGREAHAMVIDAIQQLKTEAIDASVGR